MRFINHKPIGSGCHEPKSSRTSGLQIKSHNFTCDKVGSKRNWIKMDWIDELMLENFSRPHTMYEVGLRWRSKTKKRQSEVSPTWHYFRRRLSQWPEPRNETQRELMLWRTILEDKIQFKGSICCQLLQIDPIHVLQPWTPIQGPLYT